MIDYVRYWCKDVFASIDNRRRQFLSLTPIDNLVQIYLAVIILATILVVLASCQGQSFQVSDPGKLVGIRCSTPGQHYMNTNMIRRYLKQGIDPCDCIGNKGNSRMCRLTGPQVVEPPKTGAKTVYKKR